MVSWQRTISRLYDEEKSIIIQLDAGDEVRKEMNDADRFLKETERKKKI